MLLTLATPAVVMAFSISFRFKASFKGVRACISFLQSTWRHFIPPKSVIIQMMESHRKMLLSLSFARPNPKTKTTNTKGMANIENSLNQAAWCRTHISNIMILPPTASQRPLCPSLHHILFAPYNCRFLLLRSPAILILVSGWFYLQFSSMACFLHDFGDSEKFGISTFRQHFPKHNLS